MRFRAEFFVVGTALAGAIASFCWFQGFEGAGFAKNPAVDASAVPWRKPPVPSKVDPVAEPAAAIVRWSAPPAQSRGSRWIYDIFTPPKIFYDAARREFAVTPPATSSESREVADSTERAAQPFAMRLVAVVRVPFRLQMIGFLRTPDGVMGLFENRVTSAVVLAGEGKLLPELGLAIDGIEVNRTEAQAAVRDVVSGEVTTLNNTQRRYCPVPRATIETDLAKGTVRDVGAGDEIEIGGVAYLIGEIQLSPAAISVTRRLAGHGSIDERRTLTLAEADLSEADDPST